MPAYGKQSPRLRGERRAGAAAKRGNSKAAGCAADGERGLQSNRRTAKPVAARRKQQDLRLPGRRKEEDGMRRKDREISAVEALAIVDKCEYAVLSMIDGQGQPYCVPVSIVRDQNTVYFHCAPEGAKTDALRGDPHVCLACVGDTCRAVDQFTTEYESAIVRGIAGEVVNAGEKKRALRLLCERHTPANMGNFDEAVEKSLAVTAVWGVKICEITGKQKKGRT